MTDDLGTRNAVVIERTFDALGREVLRALPRGGHMLCRYDGLGARVERQIARPYATTSGPAWVGPRPPGTTFAKPSAAR